MLLFAVKCLQCINATDEKKSASSETELDNSLSVKYFHKLLASEDDEIVNILFSSAAAGTSGGAASIINSRGSGIDNGIQTSKNDFFSLLETSLLKTSSEGSSEKHSSITCALCNTDISMTGGKRKDDLHSRLGISKEDITTILNSDTKSCYVVHMKVKDVDDLINEHDENYMVMPLSFDNKIRKNTINLILDPSRKVPIILDVLLLNDKSERNGEQILQDIKGLAKSNILSEMSFVPKGLHNSNNKRLKSKVEEQASELCSSSYDQLNPTLSSTSGGNEIKSLYINSEKMKNYIVSSYDSFGKKIKNIISAIDIYQKCMLSLTLSISLQPYVGSVEVKSQVAFMNDHMQYLIQNFTSKQYPWYDVGLNGDGEVVAMSDTGIDVNNCYFWDAINGGDESFVYGPDNIDLNQRKIVQYDDAADKFDLSGHGTHVAGSYVGHRAIDGISESRGRANGAAYKAKLAVMDIAYNNGTVIDIDATRLLNTGRPYASLHSASWGELDNFYYTEFAMEIDNFIYNNDDFVYVVAAGNSGGFNRFSTINSPGTAKNVITVGASESAGADLARDMLGPSYIADFSSKVRLFNYILFVTSEKLY